MRAIATKDSYRASAVASKTNATPVTVSKTSFDSVSGDIDSQITFTSYQGGAGTAPGNYNDAIRLYQNGGYITISSKSGYKMTSVTITTTNTYDSTTIAYKIDSGSYSANETLAKNSSKTVSGISASAVSFICNGTTNKTRLEIGAISVTYIQE